ncbi:uncharacterized protein [Parasteatoda tepidariorum]|uniref:uncharacterized protein n=1 Tax=Parasteatoda tepidariorum TaxID=114398 RepID=UPI00077FA687|nr:ATP-dependent RNA helicase DEAH12, chloroplastic [Parasteatoda tepidariorum]XP_042903313.1 ATP-dependent RNA helicase DEAH12, chloroplastic [Parasteatoda tepidariorum]XP_042903314.1 ATP-dependent RNA helicase DEAH12, chloroplastic [Parasteatoda tepidariorum]
MDSEESFTSSDSDWEDVEDTKAMKNDVRSCNSEPTDHTMNPESHLGCDASKKNPCTIIKQTARKSKNKTKFGKKGKFLKSNSKSSIAKSEKIDSRTSVLSRLSSSEAEAPIRKFDPIPDSLYMNKEKFQLSESPEKLTIPFSMSMTNRNNYDLNDSADELSQSPPRFNSCYIQKDENSTNSQSIRFHSENEGNTYFGSDSGSDSDSKNSLFSWSFSERPVNKEKHTKRSTSLFESSDAKTTRQLGSSSSKNHIPDPCKTPKTYHLSSEYLQQVNCQSYERKPASISPELPSATVKLATAVQRNEKNSPHQLHFDPQDIKMKQQFSKIEIDNEAKRKGLFSERKPPTRFSQASLRNDKFDILHQEIQNRNSFDQDIPTHIKMKQQYSEIDNEAKRKELFYKRQPPTNFSQVSLTSEKFDIVHQEIQNRNSRPFITDNQVRSSDQNVKQQYLGKRIDYDSEKSSTNRRESSNNPLSSNYEIYPNDITHLTTEDDELNLNSLDFISCCRKELEKISEEAINKVSSKKEDLRSISESENTKIKNILTKRIENFDSQQNQFIDIITHAKNQISYTSCQNYEDIVKTWDAIKSTVQNESKLFENFFPAYAYRDEVVQSLNHKRILFLHSSNAYFFNILVPLISLKHYPSCFIVSCVSGETQKQYLKYSLHSAMGSKEQKHKTYVMTESELLNYSLKIDYAAKKTTCVVLNLPLSRSVVTDILLSNLRDILKENKNSKLVLIIDPVVNLTPYKKYFSMFEISTIVPPNLTYPVNTIWKNNALVPENDILNEIVRTILSIHITKSWGNILAFVPSLRDAKTVNQLLKKQCAVYQYNSVKIILVEENYYAICSDEIREKNSKFQFVFISVGSAEMISLPSVHFIVDCGTVTDYHLDDNKKVDVLATVFISSVKSKLRKTLGGVYGPGMCYRIYSKHNFINDMPSQDYPELLLRNPLNSLVKILKYKPDVVLKEFIEFLPEGVVAETIRNLEKYGAIVDNKVSLIGEKLIKLPFEAKYSKLILLGIESGLALETVVLVSFLTEKGKLFKSTDNPKYQRIIDAKQMELVQHQSDTLTNLHIYKTCLRNKFDLEWCKTHYIDDNFLKRVHQRVEEMREIIFSSLEIKISENFSNNENWPMIVREIIYDCFRDNLCVFSGRLDCGFRVLSSKSVAYLPTQSIICQKDNVPQFLIFDHVLLSDKNYLINVTSIPSDFVMKSLQDGSSYFSDNELFDYTLTKRTIEPVGEEVMNDIFLGEDDEKLKLVIEQIKQKTGIDLISIEPSVEKGSVSIYAFPTCIDAAYEALKKILKTKSEEIINECQTHSYELVKDDKSVILEVELAKGAMAKYVKVGEILIQPLTVANVHSAGIFTSAAKQYNRFPYSLHIAWIRRHCNGNANVDFGENTNFSSVRRLSLRHLYFLGMEIFMEMSERKKNQLCISGLSPEICQEKLKDELKILLPAAEITHIELMRIAPFETSDKRLKAIKSSISNICKNALDMSSTEIVLSKPKPSDIIQELYIKTNTYEGLDSVADLVKIKFLEDKLSITTLAFNLRIICNNYIYQALQSQLNSTLSELKNDLSQGNAKADFEINVGKGSEETYFIDVSATNVAVLNLVHETINCLLNGVILNENDIKDLDKMFCHGGHVWLKGLEASENLYIIMNRQRKVLRLYGAEVNCENAKKRLIQYLKDIENDVNDIIELSSEKTKNFLLKALVQKYGIDLKKFIEECKLHQAYLDLRTAKLYVYGDQTSVEEASNCIQNLLENLDSVNSEAILYQEICPVCLCPAINLTYRLEHCGHLYHSEPCIQQFMENNEDFPIKCSTEGCEKELVLKDIWKMLRNNPERMKSLIKKSIANYLERHVLEVVLCPTPDCSMFFYKSEILGDKTHCGLCQNDICIKCHCIEHSGFTCQMYEGTKKDADYSYKVWAQTANCKRCPRCKTAIEKSEGCNHMTCRNCSGHFCWLCPSETAQVWATGNECYAHINRAHTGQLFDYN